MAGAAFFDLDRTLLAGASGPVLSAAMRTAGVTSRTLPGEKFLYGVFNTIGETLPSMVLARQAVVFAKGRPREAMVVAAETAADELVEMVQPFAHGVLEAHRQAGRPVVMATTTPYDLIKPLADRLGLDDVIATRYGVDGDGTYDGTLVGPFVWSTGKLDAVRRWADEHGIDLAQSYAYSDSVYDSPLLGAVGNPFVVNPDPRMVVMAAARRWPVLNFDLPDGVLKVPVVGVELQKVLQQFARPELIPYARFDIAGIENVPRDGPAILCMNHRSYFDPVAAGLVLAKAGRAARFLGKKEVFDVPLVGTFLKALGGIRVDRGTGSDEPLEAAIGALDNGEVVFLAPQGTIPRGSAFFDPALKGRYGAARMAHATRAPVIPVGLWGTERVWPRSSRLPDVTNITDPPTVRVRVGPPVELKYRSLRADTERIMEAIVDQLPPEAREHRVPTEDELALTYPPGYKGDPVGEHDRRPGTD